MDIQGDCLTWNYRTEPPSYVQQEIDSMERQQPVIEEPQKPFKPRKPGIGQKKDYGYKVPDVVSGKPSGEADGSVKEALFGWRERQQSPDIRHNVVCFDDDQCDVTDMRIKENMFDLLAHTDLAQNSGSTSAGRTRRDAASAGTEKCPKKPRTNHAHVNRSNAIAEKYNKVEHKLWKMPKFEKVPPMVNSFQKPGKTKGSRNYDNPLNDVAYPGIDGKPESAKRVAFVTSQMEVEPPVDSDERFNPKAPVGDNPDENMFDV